MHEFYLDLAAALLDPAGEVLASGELSDRLRVESKPWRQRFEIPMGKVREGVVPAFLAVGIAPGQVISAPMGSLWGTLMRSEAAFDVAALLASPDEGSRRTGLETLAQRKTRIRRSIPSSSATGRTSARRRRPPLSPHAAAAAGRVLARIATEPGPADIRADAARFLAYSEADGAAEALRPLADDATRRSARPPPSA